VTRLVVLASLVAVAAPAPKETDAARLRRIYGVPDDPTGDAKFEMNGDQLRIAIPARRVGRDPDRKLPGCPRVWHDVEGDFAAVVRVSAPRLTPETLGAAVGGLVVWADHGDHLTVGFSDIGVQGREECYVAYTFPGSVRTANARSPKLGEATFVRLKREGRTITAGWSHDGKTWIDFFPDETTWGPKVKVGVYAKNLGSPAVVVAFDQYSLTLPKK
jgi:hypothetical protein